MFWFFQNNYDYQTSNGQWEFLGQLPITPYQKNQKQTRSNCCTYEKHDLMLDDTKCRIKTKTTKILLDGKSRVRRKLFLEKKTLSDNNIQKMSNF